MIKVTLIVLGKLKEPFWRAAADEYIKRLGGFCKLSLLELEPVRLSDRPSDAQIQAALEAEGRKIAEKIPAGAAVVPLCVEGRKMPSPEFAGYMDRCALKSGGVAFVIGSSYGLCEAVKRRADLRLSMSDMTFPHQLARVMLLEQIYRAFKILGGGTYHK